MMILRIFYFNATVGIVLLNKLLAGDPESKGSGCFKYIPMATVTIIKSSKKMGDKENSQNLTKRKCLFCKP